MRIITLFSVFLILSSCVLSEEKAGQKAGQKEESIHQEYLKKGGEIVNLTQTELLKNVSHAMKTGGPGYAVDFCNIQAMVIKDSLSNLNNCQISRISTKYRNPADMPISKTEKDQLRQYQKAILNGDSLKPKVYIFEDRVEFYQAITIDKGACLLCHGIPGEQIADETLRMIEARYPKDLATGYGMNDFRGAWKISFKK